MTASATAAGTVVLDRYELLERLGEGGFGAVWLGRDQRLDRAVAVKRIPIGEHPSTARRAEREALAAARLSHPAIVALFEAGRDEQAVYLVSELVRGETLAELLREGALSDHDVADIGIAMCEALAHAHARGVVHRDVKPGNVLIPDAVSDGVVAKLTDFGIASIHDGDALTATGDVVGTLAYMAPEQAEGHAATAASDVYSLGLVLYEALSGVNPIRQAGAAATARRVGMRLPALRRHRGDLPPDLCLVLDAAVMPEPQQRCDVAELREALMVAADELGDEPGTIEASRWDEVGTRTLLRTVPRAPRSLTRAPWRPAAPPPPIAVPAAVADLSDDPRPLRRQAQHVPLQGRLFAAALAAVLVAVLLPWADASSSGAAQQVDPLLAAAVCAAVVALMPRLGWIATAVVVATWLASNGAPGPAIVVAAAVAPVPLLLPLSGVWWSSPAIAVGLGVLGVAGAWPAFAGQARGVVCRAALGALGWWWLALAETLRNDRLLTGPPTPAGASESSAGAVWVSVGSVITTETVAIAGLWAAGAALLPFLVRGRAAALDLLLAAIWATGLALGTRAIAVSAGVSEPRGVVGAAALAALVAVAARAFSRV
jgi:hypothetical protein